MYVRFGTTVKEIKNEIKRIEDELNQNPRLTSFDRIALHEELEYLYSFLPKEDY